MSKLLLLLFAFCPYVFGRESTPVRSATEMLAHREQVFAGVLIGKEPNHFYTVENFTGVLIPPPYQQDRPVRDPFISFESKSILVYERGSSLYQKRTEVFDTDKEGIKQDMISSLFENLAAKIEITGIVYMGPRSSAIINGHVVFANRKYILESAVTVLEDKATHSEAKGSRAGSEDADVKRVLRKTFILKDSFAGVEYAYSVNGFEIEITQITPNTVRFRFPQDESAKIFEKDLTLNVSFRHTAQILNEKQHTEKK